MPNDKKRGPPNGKQTDTVRKVDAETNQTEPKPTTLAIANNRFFI